MGHPETGLCAAYDNPLGLSSQANETRVQISCCWVVILSISHLQFQIEEFQTNSLLLPLKRWQVCCYFFGSSSFVLSNHDLCKTIKPVMSSSTAPLYVHHWWKAPLGSAVQQLLPRAIKAGSCSTVWIFFTCGEITGAKLRQQPLEAFLGTALNAARSLALKPSRRTRLANSNFSMSKSMKDSRSVQRD